MDYFGVVGILRPENLERQKESCEAEFVKKLDLNESESKEFASLEFESVEETQKLETETGISGLMETGKL